MDRELGLDDAATASGTPCRCPFGRVACEFQESGRPLASQVVISLSCRSGFRILRLFFAAGLGAIWLAVPATSGWRGARP